MAYTVGFVFLDLAGFYAAGLPTLSGVLDVPALGAPSTATSTMTPFTISFAPPPNPPGAPGTMLITDPGGPGDFFRSGPVALWPPEPVSVMAGTALAPMTYASLSAGITTPINIGIPWYVVLGIGAATGFMFSPFNINLTSVIVGPSPTPGLVRATFRGVLSYMTLFIPRRANTMGSVDLLLSPSGNAAVPATIVSVSASNLSLSTEFTTPLSTPLLALLAPLFSGALSGPLTTRVNAALAPIVAAARAMLPTTPAGTPLFSAAATVSARRIRALSGGVVVQAVLSELVALAPAAVGPVGGGPAGGAGVEPTMLVTIDPPPEFDIVQTYVIRVRRASDLSPIQDATATIVTYMPVTGTASTISGLTNAQGLVALDATLSSRSRPSTNPTHTGQLEVTWPSLTVVKTGFQTFRQELGS